MYSYSFQMFTYFLVIVCALLSMLASAKVNSTFSKYDRIRSATGLSGAETAEKLLHLAGIYDVRVEHISGRLTDHYDPTAKVLRLSDATYNARSVAAVGVAAHECGHAMQHDEGYVPIRVRASLVPIANFGSKAAIPIILLGCLLGYNQTLVQIGIFIFSFAVLFQIVTLPVEFDASARAVRLLDEQQILQGKEVGMCKKVLGAAAMTYVAAAAASIVQLLRLIAIFGGGRRRND
jgi:hypothetical protein